MAKDTYYFSHDYNARTDKKIKKLIAKYGFLGYGIFWAIIEDLYNNANALPTDYDSIAFDLRSDLETITSIINDFELFVIEGAIFFSTSVQRRLDERNDKSVKAKESAFARWNKSERNANALPSLCDGNAIKEIKGKEKKKKNVLLEKEPKINIRQEDFYNSLIPYVPDYTPKLLRSFYDYWSEPNKSQTKMRWELQKTFELTRRLNTFKKNDNNLNKPNTSPSQSGMVY